MTFRPLASYSACQTSVCQLGVCLRLPMRLKNVSVALKCKYQSITRLHLMWSLKQNLLKPFKCLPICLEMRWKNIKGEHWCFKHRLLVITEEWAESLPTVGHFISEQIYIEQSIFAQVNHFCTAYMCVTGALHACNDKVTGWGCWLHGFVWMCVRACKFWKAEKRPPQSSCLHGGFTFPSVVIQNF